jgi:hypothetical protein
MIRSSFAVFVLCAACSGSSDPAPAGSAGSAGNSSCPDLSGAWDVTAHCESSLIGMTLQVTENDCMLSMAAPFDAFTGSVTADGTITLSGPQSCTGTATASAVSMNCTPGTCVVKLSR